MRRRAPDLVEFGCQNELTEIVMSTSTLIETGGRPMPNTSVLAAILAAAALAMYASVFVKFASP